MNIVLIGFRGAGKSTVGKRLAERLRRKFVDIDELIEDRYGAISEIVEAHGWDHFRKVEKAIIEEISGRDHLVVAPGGGAVLDGGNVKALRKNGVIIWLNATPEVLGRRLAQDPRTLTSRPTLTGIGALEEIRKVIEARIPHYQEAADLELETSALGVDEVEERILSLLGRTGDRPLALTLDESQRDGNTEGFSPANKREREGD